MIIVKIIHLIQGLQIQIYKTNSKLSQKDTKIYRSLIRIEYHIHIVEVRIHNLFQIQLLIIKHKSALQLITNLILLLQVKAHNLKSQHQTQWGLITKIRKRKLSKKDKTLLLKVQLRKHNKIIKI